MITRNKIKKALQKALDEKDPKVNHVRTVINWPMVNFRHAITSIADLPQVMEVRFEFTDEDIKNELTTAWFKTMDRSIRLIDDYKTEKVECMCIGKDIDVVRSFCDVHDIMEFVTEYFPKKKVVIVRKKS